MSPAELLITNLVLDGVCEMPPRRQAEYLRALASLTSSDDVLVQLRALAEQADALDRDCRQLRLNLGGKDAR